MPKTCIIIILLAIASCQQTAQKNEEINRAAAADSKDNNLEKLLNDSIIKDIDYKDGLRLTFRKNDGLSISFYRVNKDSAWTSISFAQWPHKALKPETTIALSNYIQGIDLCWKYIETLGQIDINHLVLMSPHTYPDILKNQVYAFKKDQDWLNYLSENSNQNNLLRRSSTYKRTSEIMLKYNVYQPVNDFLKQKGYLISAYALEKLSSISESKQKSVGIKNTILVPSPLAINIKVKKSSKNISAY